MSKRREKKAGMPRVKLDSSTKRCKLDVDGKVWMIGAKDVLQDAARDICSALGQAYRAGQQSVRPKRGK